MDISSFDPTELTATAALIIFGYLFFRFTTGRIEKKDAFVESVMTKLVEKSDASTEAMREITMALKAGNDATVEGLNTLEKGQIVHESKAKERHRELVSKPIK